MSYEILRKRSDFQRAYQHGRRVGVGGIVVFDRAGRMGPPRVGFVAGRILGRAVDRNRAKRRLREAVKRVKLEHGHDYVIVATHEVLTAPFPRVVTWLQRGVAGRPR